MQEKKGLMLVFLEGKRNGCAPRHVKRAGGQKEGYPGREVVKDRECR
jgi:hypothetical protein